MAGQEIYLESSKKSISSNVYTLKVPNFFTLSEYKDNDFEMDSPPFEFENATWCFRFDSKKDTELVFITINRLFRLKTDIPQQTIFFKMALLGANNVKDDYCDMMDESADGFQLHYVKNDFSSHDGSDTLTIIAHLFTLEAKEVDSIQVSQKMDSPDKSAIKTKDCKISLTSTEKSISSDFYSLKLPNMQTIPGKNIEYFDICSPSFKFAGANCNFIYRSDGDSMFSVGLEVLEAEKPLQNIFIKCNLMDSNDKIADSECKILHIEEIYENVTFAWFDNFDTPFCTLHVYLLMEEELEVDVNPIPTTKTTDVDALSALSQDLKTLFLSGENFDLTLKVTEREFRVHRDILVARSRVFEAMLSQNTMQNKVVLHVPDTDPQIMEQLLMYVYGGTLDIQNRENALGLYYAADKYKMAQLKEECSKFLNKPTTSSVDTILAA